MFTRRDLLRSLLFTSAGAALGRVLERTAFAETSVPATPPTSVVLLWMNGGPSHLETWDPKSGKAAGPHKSIATATPGLRISEHMGELARLTGKLAVVRGMTSKEGNHQRAHYLLHTGYAPTPTVLHPSLGGWMSKRLGEPTSGLPAFVSLGGPSEGAGFFGVQHGPLVVQSPGALPDNVAYARGVDTPRFEARRALLEGMEADYFAGTADPKVEGRRALYAKAERLMHASELTAFSLESEPASVVRAFGDTPFGRGCLTAVRLVAAGVRFVEVTLDGWDTHQDNFGRTKKLMRTFAPAMASLLTELETRHLLERTVVVWMGDFGRTPKLNANDGRDHHPAAWSAVLAGRGIRGGVVHGETDAEGAKVVRDPVRVPDLFATIASAATLRPDDVAMSPAGRPIALTEGGTPIAALRKA